MVRPVKQLGYIVVLSGLVALGCAASGDAGAATRPSAGPQASSSSSHHDAIARIIAQQGRAQQNAKPIVTWWPLEAGPHANSFRIRVNVGSRACATGQAHIRTHETPSTISVQVQQPYRTSGGCLFNLITRSYVVSLKTPIAGRTIAGAGLQWPRQDDRFLESRPNKQGVIVPLAPRVVGFKASQAFSLLQSQGFKGIIKGVLHGAPGPNAQVVAQSPDRGGIPADSRALSSGFAGTVVLTTPQ